MGTLYGVWNLDFFRFFYSGLCFKTSTLTTISLDLVVAAYPLFLTLILYIMIYARDRRYTLGVPLWKPFQVFTKIFAYTWDFKSSLIDAFSTFFFLLGMKCLAVCADYLYPVLVYQVDSSLHITSEYRLYNDASIPYLGPVHLPYAVLAIAVALVVGVLPTMFLLLYPLKLCQNAMHFFPWSWQIWFHTFMDTIQGCYKDGTEPGTYDMRWYAAVILGTRLVLMMAYIGIPGSLFPVIAAIIIVLSIIIFIISDPYKSRFNHLHAHFVTFILCIACNFVICDILVSSLVSTFTYLLMALFAMLPVLYVSSLILFRTISQLSNFLKK